MAQSSTAPRPPVLLFVCVHNAGRSQMNGGFLTHLADERVEVRSAGSAPAGRVNPAGRGVDAVRPVREEIERRVRGLLAELGIAA
ncbi:hypothetical protein [Streptomyces sp. NPDC050548]|uniref:arsenate reductase/protein-tyrosine-phosphatase family protein n=1 Tax=Streptomyces sp. NPDC050548 TaxID=3365629 RepID=UPI0037990EF8